MLGSKVTLRVAVWDSSLYVTWQEAQGKPNTGLSDPFEYQIPAASDAIPGGMENFKGLTLLASGIPVNQPPVAYYPFDGNSNDQSGNGRHLNESSGRFMSDYNLGVDYRSIVLSNNFQSLAYTNNGMREPLLSFTVSTWVKLNTIERKVEWMYLFACDNLFARFGVNSTPGNQSQIIDFGIDGSYLRTAKNSAIIPGEWFFVTFTRSANRLSIYLNGKLLSTGIVSLYPYFELNRIYIGARNNNFDYRFDGELDEYRIYDRALSESEVAFLYTYRPKVSEKNLLDGMVGYYPFDGSLNDESGYQYNGVGYNVSYVSDMFGSQKSAVGFKEQSSLEITSLTGLVNQTSMTYSLWFKDLGRGTYHDLIQVRGGWSVLRVGLFGNANFHKLRFELDPLIKWESPNVDRDKWYHIAIVRDYDAQWVVYINGEYAFRSKDFPRKYNIGSITLGSKELYFNGSIDNLRVYERALTPVDIKKIYQTELNPPQRTPVISASPISQVTTAGNRVNFCVAMSDMGSYTYQWQCNNQNIDGAVASCYIIESAVTQLNGNRYRVIVSNSAGSVISDNATLVVSNPPPPAILTQPIGKTVTAGANVSFAVIASGSGNIRYQWQFKGENILGATSSKLNLIGVKLNQAGSYRVVVESDFGSTLSEVAVLAVNGGSMPTIVTQPISQTKIEGEKVEFSVTAIGVGGLLYQWQFNQNDILGANGSTLVLNGVNSTSEGRYRAIVSNTFGSIASADALLAVNPTNIGSTGISITRGENKNSFSIGYTAKKSAKYQFESSLDLSKWTPEGSQFLGDGTFKMYLVSTNQLKSFWRLRLLP